MRDEQRRLEAGQEWPRAENERLRAERERLQQANERLRAEVEALRRAAKRQAAAWLWAFVGQQLTIYRIANGRGRPRHPEALRGRFRMRWLLRSWRITAVAAAREPYGSDQDQG